MLHVSGGNLRGSELDIVNYLTVIIHLHYKTILTLSRDKSSSVKNCLDFVSPSIKLYCCEFLCRERSMAILPCCGDWATCRTTPDGRTPYLWWSRTTSIFCVVITETPPSCTVRGNSATSSNSLLDFENICNWKLLSMSTLSIHCMYVFKNNCQNRQKYEINKLLCVCNFTLTTNIIGYRK